ncbi:SusC/RagA family TonB-linked outer membrane protein [Rhodohalobacter barkolensis]|uniref:SusC/RagA family TonB-linked outer membrane protein n=1 Tax=Rhodohalobacter barkolensis TaxID=2053187 RepID=A0A2N0VF79_9BACT|nr:SusC/RagA family TonB-linked outer membrane protein [Rhodohalobacter barkolensis]PKD42854.1 SusC/RagA family TonB-linked outer membrane protein [Rhodohalobacter barkolensis]
MLKKLLLSSLMVLVSVSFAFAQSSTVTGTITDANTDEPIPQVNVFIVELQTGDATDMDGQYSIANVEHGTYNVRISSVGYTTLEREITVDANNTTFDFQMNPDVRLLDDVVVTAFGVSREQRSLGYSVQDVNAEKLARVQQDNIVGALAGKVAGVQVVGSTSFGGSERIRIRGANGLSDGQPLFVVDGTPIANQSFVTNQGGSTTGRDLGNLASDLNLQNVESVSVLKGAAAAALYGNRAADGVILITTKNASMGENIPLQVEFNHNTTFEDVYILPEYQNEYAGGYTQNFIQYTDPRDGQTYNGLNYAADESWGPKMDGTMYRPWWSWFDHDFTGDGQNDYGTEVPLVPQENNVRDFFETGLRMSNSLSITGGSSNASFRAGLTNTSNSGIVPNSQLDRTSLSFNGALSHSDKFTSRIAFNYVNTATEGRPATGYSAVQGNSVQSFNQWFQRQLDMDKLRQYRTDDGTLMSWNIRSNTDTRPLYWDSPFFSINENKQNDDRDRIYGNYQLSYNVNENIELQGKLHLDTYSFNVEDRIATGGLEQDWFYTAQRSRREVNYEAGLRYQEDFQDVSVSGYFGGNILTQNYSSLQQQTQGGLSVPNFFNIDASIDRPGVSNYNEQKEVRSLFGTTTIGYQDLVYLDLTGRNDWSSALPADNNSFFYYGVSGSLVFTEFDMFANQDILSFGKLRASIAQVGNDLDPFRVFQTFNSGTPFGSLPTQSVPNTLFNPDLEPAISSDYEFGIDLRFLDGRLRTDVNYYNSVRENEILELDVSGASGYESTLVNAGKFTTTGWEIALGATPVQTSDWSVEVDVNWSTSKSVVDELTEGIERRLLENASFGIQLFAVEGEEWGEAITTGAYGGYLLDDEGRRIVNSNGTYALEYNKPLGNILPDWNGGFNLGVNYKDFSIGAFIDFQKGGKFYSISRMFGTYSGLTANTVGNNALGNPMRDPLVDSNGNTTYINGDGDEVAYTSLPLDQTSANTGGVLIEGVDTDGNEVAYLRNAANWGIDQFYNKEAWLEDASYIKLRELRFTYNLPVSLLDRTPISRAAVSLDLRNPLLIYSSTSGVDPTAIQNNANGFGFWEGGGLPGTRSIGFNVNLNF